ncbi:hypothetical protein [Neptuniibacter sp. QD37_11]|uniref:hypothetical protein n=1 Tax=Neptuniibacter sp. QD37_11 TaxID=3398209 RepID=UPI0039F53156
MKLKTLSQELRASVFLLASTLLDKHAKHVGSKICQDWSGPEDLKPSRVLTDEQRDVLSYNIEIRNSELRDYEKGFDGLDDEMVAGFALASALTDLGDEIVNMPKVECPVCEKKQAFVWIQKDPHEDKTIIVRDCPDCGAFAQDA